MTNTSSKINVTSFLKIILYIVVDFLLVKFFRQIMTFETTSSESITGEPIMPLLFIMLTLTDLGVIAFYVLFTECIPGKTPISKGLTYSSLYCLVVFIPTTIGLNAFSFNGIFEFMNVSKLRNITELSKAGRDFISILQRVNFVGKAGLPRASIYTIMLLKTSCKYCRV